MLQCIERHPRHCFHYQGENKAQRLNEFIRENGGVDVEFLRDGTAVISTLVKGNGRLVYLVPGAWIRVISSGQFSAVSEAVFHDRFVLIDEALAEESPHPEEKQPERVKTIARWLQMVRAGATSPKR